MDSPQNSPQSNPQNPLLSEKKRLCLLSFVCCYFVAKNPLNFVYFAVYHLFTQFALWSAS